MRALATAVILTACAATPPHVNLGAGWPQAAPDYRTAHQRWTRRGGYSDEFARVIEAAATLKSPEWRAAYARERARRQRMGPEAEAELVATERAEAEAHIDIELIVATSRMEWNDFRKGKESMWRLALVGANGVEVPAASVKEDRRPRGEIASYFPDLAHFYLAYAVRFPRVTADGRPVLDATTRRLTLKVGSAVGAVELTWSE
jgi:hypothetical protein